MAAGEMLRVKLSVHHLAYDIQPDLDKEITLIPLFVNSLYSRKLYEPCHEFGLRPTDAYLMLNRLTDMSLITSMPMQAPRPRKTLRSSAATLGHLS